MLKNTKIGLLGGAFNPVTKGHLQLANFVLDNSDVSEVWLTPCYSHMYEKKMVSPLRRLKMCELVTSLEENIKVFHEEIRTENISGTYEFLYHLINHNSIYSNYEFSYIIGMDNANTFHNWIESEKLKELIRFIVVPRQGDCPKKGVTWYKKRPHLYLSSKDPVMKVSSSEVRRLLKERDYGKAFDLLDYRVFKYAVMDNGLY